MSNPAEGTIALTAKQLGAAHALMENYGAGEDVLLERDTLGMRVTLDPDHNPRSYSVSFDGDVQGPLG